MTPAASGNARAQRARYAIFALACAVLGLWLRRDTLHTGFASDDYVQLAMIDGTYPVERSLWDLYNFSNGTAAEGDALHRQGFYPWFVHRELRLSMFRPFASWMIALDYHLFGNDALLYHWHSAAWWAFMALAVAWLLRMLLPVKVAAFSLLLFALDEAHTVPLAWIANRCAIASTVLGVLGLIAYVRYRERLRRSLGLVSALLFSIALGFGEYALCVVAYALAYELADWHRDRGCAPEQVSLVEQVRARAWALLPVAVPSVLYIGLRHALGQGPMHSGIYISPDRDPLGFAELVIKRVPVLFADLFAGLPSEMWTFGSMWSGLLHGSGWVDDRWLWSPSPWRAAHSTVGALFMLAAFLVWTAVVRALAQRESAQVSAASLPRDASLPRLERLRFLVWGSALSVLPVVGSFPSSRVLIVPAIGFAALLSTAVLLALTGIRERMRQARVRTLTVAGAGALLGAFHIVVPAWVTYADSVGMRYGSVAARKAVLTMEADKQKLPLQRVVVLAAREYGTSMYIPFTRARFGKPAPAICWTLSLTPAPHALLRESATAFRLAPMNGFAMLTTAPEELLSDPNDPFLPGSVVDLGGLKVTVLKVDGPRVQAIRVEADVPLEDPSLHFVLPGEKGIRRFPLPPVGQVAIVAAPVVPPL